ncbi:MAG: FKBP-type peptidyl-prolyl cis-trans isomerase [Acidimicrobiia bacterium]
MRSHHLAGPLAVLSLLVAAGCGDSSASGSESSDSAAPTSVDAASDSATDAASTDKPAVSIPAELPTELVITDLEDGTGAGAADGDTVLVNYVGVRSADGTEFDNSYDSGQMFPVTLGAGGVIPGWEQGLVGVKTGGRRQLDIPADLAYGDEPQGDVIQAGDALTFVIDVVAVVPASDPADAPTEAVPASTGATELSTEDLVVGEGDEVVDGAMVFVEIAAYRGDTAEEINTTWGQGGPVALEASESQTISGLYNGLLGMKVGGRRLMTIPPADAFGDAGNEELGLPAGIDLVLVVDVVAVA